MKGDISANFNYMKKLILVKIKKVLTSVRSYRIVKIFLKTIHHSNCTGCNLGRSDLTDLIN